MVQPAPDSGDVVSIASRRPRPLACLAIVRQHSRATGAARSVLTLIAAHADPDGTNARPSRDTLAAETGYSVRTVERAIRALEELGELEVVSRGGGRWANRYRVRLEALVDVPETLPEPVPARSDRATESRRRGDTVTPQGRQSVARPFLDRPLTGRGAPAGAVARCDRHRTDPNPPPCRACATARQLADADEAARRADVETRHAARVKAHLREIAETPPADPAVVAAAREAIRAQLRRGTPR